MPVWGADMTEMGIADAGECEDTIQPGRLRALNARIPSSITNAG